MSNTNNNGIEKYFVKQQADLESLPKKIPDEKNIETAIRTNIAADNIVEFNLTGFAIDSIKDGFDANIFCTTILKQAEKISQNSNFLTEEMDNLRYKIFENFIEMYRIYHPRDAKGIVQPDSDQKKQLKKLANDCIDSLKDFRGRVEEKLRDGRLFFFYEYNDDEISEDQATVCDLKISKQSIDDLFGSFYGRSQELKDNLYGAFLLNDTSDEEEKVEMVYDIKDFTTALFCAAGNVVSDTKDLIENNISSKTDVRNKLNELDRVLPNIIKTAVDAYNEFYERTNTVIRRYKNQFEESVIEAIVQKHKDILSNLNQCITENIEQLNNLADNLENSYYGKQSFTKTIRKIQDKLKKERITKKTIIFNNKQYLCEYKDIYNQNNSIINLKSNRETLENNKYS